MKLFYRSYGSGPAIFLLHGLLGSGDNWHTCAEALSGEYTVVVPDLRNHGRSVHDARFDYSSMSEDVLTLMDSMPQRRFCIIGHSMGGKVAMELSLAHPDRISAIIVEDMVPGRTTPRYRRYVDLLRNLRLGDVSTRSGAERLLAEDVPDRTLRLFLLKNLERETHGSFRWRLNLDSIARNYDEIWSELKGYRTYEGPALFIRGGRSDTVTGERAESIEHYFPKADLRTIDAADHWVHSSATKEFLEIVRPFLGEHAARNARK